MYYAVLFAILAILLFYFGIIVDFGIISALLFWLSLDLLLISLSYLFNKTFIFGKQRTGKLQIESIFLLYPYLLFIRVIWRFSLIFDSSKPFHQLTENVWIGRRLLDKEEIQNIDLVIDLTCEFSESPRLVVANEYLSFPILDAGVPDANKFKSLLNYINSFKGDIYVHCAQGSGRTGLVACGYLVFTARANTFEEAYQFVQLKRPRIKLNAEQIRFLKKK